MGSELRFVELSSLVSEKPRNGLYKGKEFQGEGHRWIKMGDIYANNFFLDQKTELLSVTKSEIDRFSCMDGDLLFGRTSLTLEGVGDCMLIGDVSDWPIFESNLFRLRLDQKHASPLFYFYYFKSPHGKQLIQKIAKQTAAASITATDLIEQPVPYFDLSVQRKIADLIFAFDNKIALNRQINTTLESMAQALFKSWFVDFDPVIDNALAAGNEIPDALQKRAAARAARREALRQQTNKTSETTGATAATSSEQALPETGLSDQRLPPEIQQLFPDRFVLTEEMGWVPEGWEFSQLSSQIDVLNGFAFKSGDYSESGIFVLRTKNFNSDSMVDLLPDDVFLPDEFKVSHNKYLCESFDYHLIMVGASVGNRGMIMPHQLPALRNQNMWCFRPTNTGIVSRVFTKHLLDTLIVEKMGLASGSAREFFRKGDFQSHWMVVGSKKIQEAFEAIAQAYLSKQAINLAQADYLADLRDALLPKLLSGQITLPDVEQQLAEVL